MTELFVIMSSFTITEINKNQWICNIQIVWKLSLQKFAKDHCFWTLWTLNYVDCIPFLLVLVLSIRLTINPNKLRTFYSQVSEKQDQTSIFVEGSYKSSPVHLSICLSVHPFVMYFLWIYSVDFLNFLNEDILQYTLKSNKSRFWKIAFVV